MLKRLSKNLLSDEDSEVAFNRRALTIFIEVGSKSGLLLNARFTVQIKYAEADIQTAEVSKIKFKFY